jgi:hypothetical protein
MPRRRAAADKSAPSIPLDAEGNPVFLILSAVDQKRYDRYMKSCEAGWRMTQDPWFISEAQTLTHIYRQPLLAWQKEAVRLLADDRRTKLNAKQAADRSLRFARYCIVRDIKARGKLTDDEAFEEAERVWKNNPKIGAGHVMMGKAYQAVKRDIKNGRFGLYYVPHPQRPIA